MDGIVCLVPHTWTRADGSIRIKIDWNELIGQGQCNVCLYRANIPFGLGPIKKIQVTDNLPELVCSKASVSETWNGETIIKKPCKSLIIVWQWHGFTDNFPVISCFVIHVRLDNNNNINNMQHAPATKEPNILDLVLSNLYTKLLPIFRSKILRLHCASLFVSSSVLCDLLTAFVSADEFASVILTSLSLWLRMVGTRMFSWPTISTENYQQSQIFQS